MFVVETCLLRAQQYDEAITAAGADDIDYLRMKRDNLGITSKS